MAICKRLLLILICGFMLSACATTSKQPSVCETNDRPSYLCEIADKSGVTLEEISKTLIIVNEGAVWGGAYSPEDALEVLKHLQGILKNPVSYLFFRSQVRKQLDKYPALFQVVAEAYIDQFKSPQIMHPFDRGLLRSWVNSRIRDMEELNQWPQ